MIAPKTLRAAEAHLAAVDPVMAKLIAHFGPSTLGRKPRDAFHVICGSIISQQLSTKAADTIQRRVAAHIGAPEDAFTPGHFGAASIESLRACGLSNAKGKWLLELAERAQDGRFHGPTLAQLDNEALVAELDAIPGIGLWTAEMMMIFAFDRIDVFSMGDVGLRRSINQLYAPKGRDGKPKKLDDKKTLKIVNRWAPYKSVACWYLWRGIDGDITTWA